MELGCIGLILGIYMQGNGVTGSVMDMGFILVKMEAVIQGSLSGVSNMDWVIIISGNHLRAFATVSFWISSY